MFILYFQEQFIDRLKGYLQNYSDWTERKSKKLLEQKMHKNNFVESYGYEHTPTTKNILIGRTNDEKLGNVRTNYF